MCIFQSFSKINLFGSKTQNAFCAGMPGTYSLENLCRSNSLLNKGLSGECEVISYSNFQQMGQAMTS